VGLKKRSPLISACPLGWRSAGIAASGCSTGKADLIAIPAAFKQTKEMLQHDATTIKPMVNFNYLRNKNLG